MTVQRKNTSIDVAKLAGVSQATVSRTLNNPESVSEETRSRVMNAARELNYLPNAIARSLVSNKTNMIGVIVDHFENPFYSSFIHLISEKLNARGQKVLLFNNAKSANIEDILNEAMCFRVEGLLIASSLLSQQLAEKSIPTRIPVVLINRQIVSEKYCSVASDDVDSGRIVADFFKNKGFSSFAFISGLAHMPSSYQRQNGFLGRLQEWGFSSFMVEKGEYTYESGLSAMNRIIEHYDGKPTAVFCANDLMALGAIDAIRRHPPLRIPEDFSIIGFDDINQSSWDAYRLTTMRLPINSMIDTAFEYFSSYKNSACKLAGRHLFPCQLIERETT